MNENEFNIHLENAFKAKLKEQISIEGQLMMSGRAVKIEKIGSLSVTLQPGSLDSNKLLAQNRTNLHFAGAIEIYPKYEDDEIKPNELYSFEAFGIEVMFNSEKREFEFQSKIALSNINKR